MAEVLSFLGAKGICTPKIKLIRYNLSMEDATKMGSGQATLDFTGSKRNYALK